MAVNKEQAEKCRDMGLDGMKRRDWDRAIKFLSKSLQLHPLPGVEALLAQAQRMKNGGGGNGGAASSSSSTSSDARQAGTRTSTSSAPNNSNPRASSTSTSSSAPSNGGSQTNASSSSREKTGPDGRSYTPEQAEVAQRVLRSKAQGGRGAHYRVLQLDRNCNDADIKKAYRKLALKLHPDKNAAPHAAEAFKAVGLAYATLSDPQKRHLYDRYDQEDPDNRGGGGGGGGGGFGGRGGGMHAADVNPEDIFNMFFGGGMPGDAFRTGGGNGFHFYSTGFGPGVQFRRAQQPPRAANARNADPRNEPHAQIISMLVQLIPIVLIASMSLFRFGDQEPRGMPGVNKYFSLSPKTPFVNRLESRVTNVKGIPFYVDDRFLKTYYRNRHQLFQVEQMVERAYEDFLLTECKTQLAYKKKLEVGAQQQHGGDEVAKRKAVERAAAFELSRCLELEDLFPRRKRGNGYGTGFA